MHINNYTPGLWAYPMDQLPPWLRQVIEEAEYAVQSPRPLVASAALTSMAASVQGLVDVQTPARGIVATCLSMAVIGPSGEGRTATDKLLGTSLIAAQDEWQQEVRASKPAIEAAQITHAEEEKNLKRRIRARIRSGQDPADLMSELTQMIARKPRDPTMPRLIFEDTTIEALLESLASGWPYALLRSSEGASVLNSHAMRQMATLNQLWDGSNAIHVSRKSTESFVLTNARLTMSIMVQRGAFEAFLKRAGDAAWDVGFLSRLLIAEPASRQGERNIIRPDRDFPALAAFHATITARLKMTRILCQNKQPRKVLAFSPAAATRWLDYAATTERRLAIGGPYQAIKGFASRLSEQAARLAGIMSAFEDLGSEIQEEHVQAAITLCDWYASEFLRLFGPVDDATLAQQYGQTLWEWLQKSYMGSGLTDYRVSTLYKFGPNMLREREKLYIAINYLAQNGLVFDYRNSRPQFIRVNLYAGQVTFPNAGNQYATRTYSRWNQ